MEAKILSLNIGGPSDMTWQGRSIRSSMLKKSTAGPLVVHQDRIEGNDFASPQHHGTVDSILYAYGLTSIHPYLSLLGIQSYQPGELGETLTLDEFDEDKISIGDVFQIGEVEAQVSYPRIPCGKINYRLQHADGQSAMQEFGKSGVYFRILKPGLIHQADRVVRREPAKHSLPLGPFYRKLMRGDAFSAEEFASAERNGALPAKALARLPRAST